MNRQITITISKEEQEILRKAANILRFMSDGVDNENVCYTPRNIVDMANRNYTPKNEYLDIIYEE